jgi:ArsR family transcriptional regulator, arsenate/arsenite/antimonite-responsive transcriptional repressor
MKQQEVFRAIADPTRRAILKRLQGGALSAGEIGTAFDMTAASLSHHFAVLKQADLVRTERRGQYIVYSLNSTVFEDLARMVLDLFPPKENPSRGSSGGKR